MENSVQKTFWHYCIVKFCNMFYSHPSYSRLWLLCNFHVWRLYCVQWYFMLLCVPFQFSKTLQFSLLQSIYLTAIFDISLLVKVDSLSLHGHSSIGMAKAALEAINGCNLFGEKGASWSVIFVDIDAHNRNRSIFETLLPRESSSKVLLLREVFCCSIFSFNISVSKEINEYVEFQQWYNKAAGNSKDSKKKKT